MPFRIDKWLCLTLTFGTILTYSQPAATNSQFSINGIVRASSEAYGLVASNITDKNQSTFWMSGSPLPDGFISQAGQNLLFGLAPVSSLSGLTTGSNVSHATDGNLSTATHVSFLSGTESKLVLDLPASSFVQFLMIKLKTNTAPVQVSVTKTSGAVQHVGIVTSTSNYKILKLYVNHDISRVSLSSIDPFSVYEIAAAPEVLSEYIIVDMLTSQKVTGISALYKNAKDIDSVHLQYSQDGLNWNTETSLDPSKFHADNITFANPLNTRYLKLNHYLSRNWSKAQLYELTIFGDDSLNGNWQSRAGIIDHSYGYVNIKASSEKTEKPAALIMDNESSTCWESVNPFPNNFISSKKQNLLLFLQNNLNINVNGTLGLQTGFLSNQLLGGMSISKQNNKAQVKFEFPANYDVDQLVIKAKSQGSPIEVSVRTQNGSVKQVLTYSASDNYQYLKVDIKKKINKIIITSNASFTIYDIGATPHALYEDVVVDFGSPKEIGWIKTLYIPNASLDSVHALVSNDSLNWTLVAKPSPSISGGTVIKASPQTNSRYLMLRHFLDNADWTNAKLWELDVYDREGENGPLPVPEPSYRPLEEMVGINAIWGWGNNKYSDLLGSNEGPSLFRKVSTHARNYQNMNWDTPDPDSTPDYDNMRMNIWWLDWDREYQAWKDAGLEVQVTIQFSANKQAPHRWNTPFQSAYNYGYAFARHFGPTHGNGLVSTMEIGNEPWDYDSAFYRTVLHGMAAGAKAADPQMIVLPCALQSDRPESEGGYKNFTGSRITPVEAQFLDGINSHKYSFTNDPVTGTRRATHPEDPSSGFRRLIHDKRFLETNMPGKLWYVSEWGWDSDGGGQNCTHNVCVSEKAQAVYAARGLFILDRLGVDKAQWFFYGNTTPGVSSLYSHSGLLSHKDAGGHKKRSFRVFETIMHRLGDRYFLDVLQEDNSGWAYLYGDSLGNATHIVAWKPSEAEDLTINTLNLSTNVPADSTWEISGLSSNGTLSVSPLFANGMLTVEVSSTPKLIKLAVPVQKSSVVATPPGKPEQAIENGWQIYPNPVKENFTINYHSYFEAQLKVRLLSADGKTSVQVGNYPIHEGSNFIDIRNNCPPGYYILEGTISRIENAPGYTVLRTPLVIR